MLRITFGSNASQISPDGTQEIKGPCVIYRDSITYEGEVITSGEWVVTQDGQMHRTAQFTHHEVLIVWPLLMGFLVLLASHWFHRVIKLFVIFASVTALQGQTVTSTWIVKDWSPTAPTLPTFPNGTASRFIAVYNSTSGALMSYTSHQTSPLSRTEGTSFRMVAGYIRPATTTFVPFGNWVQSSRMMSNGQPQTPNLGGPIDGNGVPVAPDGSPVNPDGTPSAASGHKADATQTNPYSHPATPIWYVNPTGGKPPYKIVGQPLQPGQSGTQPIIEGNPFTWSGGWLVDGIEYPTVGGGGSSSPVIGITPPQVQPPMQPPTTPPITPPTNAPAGDTTAAVNRLATIATQYGESARTSANIANNNMDKIKEQFQKSIDELAKIADSTADTAANTLNGSGAGSGGGSGSTVEGDNLIAINNKLGTAQTVPQVIQDPENNNLGNDNKKAQMDAVRNDIAAIQNSLNNLVSSLTPSGTNATSAWNFSIPNPISGGSIPFNIESAAGGWLDVMRAVTLAFMSLYFVRRMLVVARGAFVDGHA